MSQESFDKHQLILYRIEQAKETLQDAHLLFNGEGSLQSIINRAYYAMFYSTLALLTTLEKGSSKHSGASSCLEIRAGEIRISVSPFQTCTTLLSAV